MFVCVFVLILSTCPYLFNAGRFDTQILKCDWMINHQQTKSVSVLRINKNKPLLSRVANYLDTYLRLQIKRRCILLAFKVRTYKYLVSIHCIAGNTFLNLNCKMIKCKTHEIMKEAGEFFTDNLQILFLSPN